MFKKLFDLLPISIHIHSRKPSQEAVRKVVQDKKEWDRGCALGLKTFLESHVGKALLQEFEKHEKEVNAWAIGSLNNTHEEREFRAGVATGIIMKHQQIQMLAQVQEEENLEASEEELAKFFTSRIYGYQH